MRTLEKVQTIELHHDFNSFCTSQASCSNCVLLNTDLISDDYYQPCKSIYSLLQIIKEQSKGEMKMARVTKFTASYGLSASINGNWHKFQTAIEIEVDPQDDVQSVKERAWNTCYNEIEKQIEELSR